jgi:hypothetical protein
VCPRCRRGGGHRRDCREAAEGVHVTRKTRFTGIENVDAMRKGETIHATVIQEDRKYNAVTILAT